MRPQFLRSSAAACLGLAALAASAVAQPANDTCDTGFALTIGTPVMGSTAGADFSLGAPCGQSMLSDPDVWYVFTTPAPGAYRFSASGAVNADLSLAVISACDFPFAAYGCDAGSPDGQQVDVSSFFAGETLRVRIGSNVAQDFVLTVGSTPPPANDGCGGAIPIAVGEQRAGSNLAATTDVAFADAALCSSVDPEFASDADVFYVFTAPGDAYYNFDTCGSTIDTVLSVHAACPATPGNAIACNDNGALNGCNAPFQDNTSHIPGVFFSTGTTVYIRVASATHFGFTGTGDFNVRVMYGSPAPVPANDTCATAEVLAPNSAVPGTTVNATSGGTTCGFEDVWDVWYQFTSPEPVATLFRFEISPGSFGGQATMAAFDACGGTMFVCQDYGPFTVPDMILDVTLQPGETMYLRIAGQGATQDDFMLAAQTGPAAAPNSTCEGAVAIAANTPVNVDTSTASSSAASPCAGFPDIYALWYSFTTTQAGYYRFATDFPEGNGRTTIGAYAACGQGPIVCSLRGDTYSTNPAAGAISPYLDAGQTVYLRVAFDGSQRGQFTLTASGPLAPPPAVSNDSCANAEVFSGRTFSDQVDITAATDDLEICVAEGEPGQTAYQGIWYRYTPLSDVYLVASASPSDEGHDGRVTVFTGECGSLTQAYCPPAFGGPAPILLNGGVTYTILASITPQREGGFTRVPYGTVMTLEVETLEPPANDDCESAQVIASPGTVEFTTLVADADPPQPSCIGQGGVLNNAVWFTFTTGTSGDLTVHGESQDWDHYLYSPGGALFTGACGALTEVACDSPLNGMFITREFDFAAPLAAGTQYWLAVGAFGGPAGGDTTVTLSYTGDFAPTCDPDVNCDGAVNGFDVEAMEQAVNGDMTNFCQSDPDYNRDGSLNGFDIEAVEQGVNGAPCP